MNTTNLASSTSAALAHELSEKFATRSAAHDESGQFVESNFKDLKAAKAFSLHVPTELGGGGVSYAELCDFLRVLAHGCGSTALSFSMHSHLLAALVYRWNVLKAPVDTLLKRVVAEQLVLVSSGGSDWLNGSGVAEKVEGGYKFSGRKIFASASPMGDLLMTMGVVSKPGQSPTVIHFPVSFKSPEVKVLNTWDVMGMRGTGSHDLEIKDLFIADNAVALERPQGKWHPAMQLVAKIAIPLIYSVYFGVAEAAADVARKECTKKRTNPDTQAAIGEMQNELTAARLAWNAMVTLGASATPGDESTSIVMTYRTLVAHAVTQTVEKAMRAVGGPGFYRALGLERMFRDIQGAHYHPLQDKPQTRLSGRFALGLPLDE